MSTSSQTEDPSPRGRGRGRSRGGLGKYLRASGRGKGRGRPAEFSKRLLLEGEEVEEETEEEAEERLRKFSRRELGSNADRYTEPEPELDSDGEPIVEPEVDLSAFLERQRISELPEPLSLTPTEDIDQDDVDHTISHISSATRPSKPQKGNMKQIEWNEELDELCREKASAEATRELISRFRAKSTKLRNPVVENRNRRADTYLDAPPLPIPEGSEPPQKDPKQEMEDFLDGLLT